MTKFTTNKKKMNKIKGEEKPKKKGRLYFIENIFWIEIYIF